MVSVCSRLAKRVFQLAQSFSTLMAMRDVVERLLLEASSLRGGPLISNLLT
jgi:hypothetical protein